MDFCKIIIMENFDLGHIPTDKFIHCIIKCLTEHQVCNAYLFAITSGIHRPSGTQVRNCGRVILLSMRASVCQFRYSFQYFVPVRLRQRV